MLRWLLNDWPFKSYPNGEPSAPTSSSLIITPLQFPYSNPALSSTQWWHIITPMAAHHHLIPLNRHPNPALSSPNAAHSSPHWSPIITPMEPYHPAQINLHVLLIHKSLAQINLPPQTRGRLLCRITQGVEQTFPTCSLLSCSKNDSRHVMVLKKSLKIKSKKKLKVKLCSRFAPHEKGFISTSTNPAIVKFTQWMEIWKVYKSVRILILLIWGWTLGINYTQHSVDERMKHL